MQLATGLLAVELGLTRRHCRDPLGLRPVCLGLLEQLADVLASLAEIAAGFLPVELCTFQHRRRSLLRLRPFSLGGVGHLGRSATGVHEQLGSGVFSLGPFGLRLLEELGGVLPIGPGLLGQLRRMGLGPLGELLGCRLRLFDQLRCFASGRLDALARRPLRLRSHRLGLGPRSLGLRPLCLGFLNELIGLVPSHLETVGGLFAVEPGFLADVVGLVSGLGDHGLGALSGLLDDVAGLALALEDQLGCGALLVDSLRQGLLAQLIGVPARLLE